MIEIGGKPIPWHIMKEYSYYGFNEFIICCGYKQHMIKEWFADYFLYNSDITFDFTKNVSTILERDPLENLAREGELMSYRHEGFWQCMDSMREKNMLETLWKTGDAKWKVWKD